VSAGVIAPVGCIESDDEARSRGRSRSRSRDWGRNLRGERNWAHKSQRCHKMGESPLY